MFFKTKKSQHVVPIVTIEREIKLKKEVLDSILSYCQMKPNLLRCSNGTHIF